MISLILSGKDEDLTRDKNDKGRAMRMALVATGVHARLDRT
jgi:hypothetical protein